MKNAVRACKKWFKYDSSFSVSVSVSALQMLDNSFTTNVVDLLRQEQKATTNVVLEITESYMFRNIN